ncbi:LytTR family DNA-binding domain-containing protein [Oceanispirochaeta sp.]|jgi:DNA-binding LytR/AlgR family response regulator|uniref:LytR/AlgR family response regulator transcription factor n=1 Tax=Oceanispirochaeta sp. TaxID=2035350 RepID=UPI00263449DE|nr:LytTR family DNA-binding domain-containing protein [Oceanispirochaeta sp.]MDA3958159.1 LytTR family DNA-binding domain-containing protein [Oceanispirochaeta sp.]
MIRVLVVDDEKPARDELCWLLEKQPDVKVVAQAENGMKALSSLEKEEVDLILLDIQMPGMTGLETARQILDRSHFPQIIFVTAYDQFAIEAFDVNALDYLLKPIEEDRLERALNRGRNRLMKEDGISDFEQKIKSLFNNENLSGGKENIRKLTVYYDGRFIPIDFDNILMMTAEDKYSRIYTKDGSFTYRKSLSDLEELISDDTLFKCHRSYSVNLNYVEAVEPWFNNAYRIKLKHVEELIPVSRSRTAELKTLFHMD